MLEPDLTQAAAFIGALTKTDGWNAVMTWQYADDTPQKRVTLAAVLNGSLTDCAEELHYANNRGAGIFVTIQRTNLRGRTWDCIEEPRALFIDVDDLDPREFELAPSMTVRTPHGEHAYWFLEPGVPLGAIPDAQKQLAAFYLADKAVSDITRAMRVPGFYHCKETPTVATLTSCEPTRRYTLDAVLAAHPIEMPAYAPTPWRTPPTHSLAAFHAWSMCKPMTEGGRNRNAYIIAAEGLKRDFEPSDVETVVRDYCHRSGLSENEAMSVMRSAIRRRSRAS